MEKNIVLIKLSDEQQKVLDAYRTAEDVLFTRLNEGRKAQQTDAETSKEIPLWLENMVHFDALIEASEVMWREVMTAEQRQQRDQFLQHPDLHKGFTTPLDKVEQVMTDLAVANEVMGGVHLVEFEMVMWPLLREALLAYQAEQADGKQ